MKRVISSSVKNHLQNIEPRYTISDIVHILGQIEQLKGCMIEFTEDLDKGATLIIDGQTYSFV